MIAAVICAFVVIEILGAAFIGAIHARHSNTP